jgi:hypothetical protein
LDKIIELLNAEKEHREQIEAEQRVKDNEKRLMEYASKHNKRYPLTAHTTNELGDMPVKGVTDCIPYNLTEVQKETLRFFYENSDNREK